MIKVGIIGGSGMAGSAIYQAAKAAGYLPTAIVRSEQKAKEVLGADASILVTDAFTLTKADLQTYDVVVNAFSALPAQAYRHTDLAAHLVKELRETTAPRLIFILGAGSLFTGDDHHRVAQDILADPDNDSWSAIPANQLKELLFLEQVDNVDWVGISPGSLFEAGPETSALEGQDELLVADNGQSVTTSGTMAAAVVKEIADQQHHHERFTVINAE